MNKLNCRPISFLAATLSRILKYLKVYFVVDQMSGAMETIFSRHTSGFRRHHSLPSVIVNFTGCRCHGQKVP